MRSSIATAVAVIFSIMLLQSCADTYKSGGVKYKVKDEKVLESSYGKKKIAKYFYRKPHVKSGGNIYVVGSVDAPGNSAPSRCEIAADMQARVELAGELSTRIDHELAFAAKGYAIDGQSLSQITKQITRIENLQGVSIDNRYWEKRLVQNGPDVYLKYTCYSRAVMPLEALKEKTKALLAEYEAKRKLPDGIVEKAVVAWDEFFKPVEVNDEDLVKEENIPQE